MKKHVQYSFSLAVAMLFSISAFAQDHPDTLSTFYGEGMDTYVANRNNDATSVDKNYSSINWSGHNSILTIRNYDNGTAIRIMIAYLKFDLSYIESITDAFIGLNIIYNQKWGVDSVEVAVYGLTCQKDDWVDTSLTFNTAPGLYEATPDVYDYEINYDEAEFLTIITILKDSLGWVYSKPAQEMDDFINADTNDLVTFILLLEDTVNTDEIRISSEGDTIGAPILHGAEIQITSIESNYQAGENMLQNYPNPFRGSTNISYSLGQSGQVSLKVYNISGQLVATLADGIQRAGDHRVDWNAKNAANAALPEGIYFAQIISGSYTKTIRMNLMK